MPEGFGTRTDRSPEREKTGRPEEVRVFPRTGGTHQATVRNPGALRGRLGAGVVATMPRYGAYVPLSRAPRETALYPVYCSRCIVPTASLPGGIRRPHILRSVEEPWVICRVFSRCRDPLECRAMSRLGVSEWFAMFRFRGDPPECAAMRRFGASGMVRFAGGRGASLRVTFSGRWRNRAGYGAYSPGAPAGGGTVSVLSR